MKSSSIAFFVLILSINSAAQESTEVKADRDQLIEERNKTEDKSGEEKPPFFDQAKVFTNRKKPLEGLTDHGLNLMKYLRIYLLINPILSDTNNIVNAKIPDCLKKQIHKKSITYKGLWEAIIKIISVMEMPIIDADMVLSVKPQFLMTCDITSAEATNEYIRTKILIRVYGVKQNLTNETICFNMLYEDSRWGQSDINGREINSNIVQESVLNAFENGLLISLVDRLPVGNIYNATKRLDQMIHCDGLARIGGD